MKKIGLLLTFLLVATVFFAQNREKRRDSDITEHLDLCDFTTIEAELGADIYIRQADTFSVVVEGSEQSIDRMKTRVKDGKLLITKQYNWQVLETSLYKVNGQGKNSIFCWKARTMLRQTIWILRN